MDFSLSPELVDLQTRTRDFIANQIIPYERDTRMTDHGPTEDLCKELIALARKAGSASPSSMAVST